MLLLRCVFVLLCFEQQDESDDHLKLFSAQTILQQFWYVVLRVLLQINAIHDISAYDSVDLALIFWRCISQGVESSSLQ